MPGIFRVCLESARLDGKVMYLWVQVQWSFLKRAMDELKACWSRRGKKLDLQLPKL